MKKVSNLIEAEIRERGLISFARFMELALYAPGLGYYERQREIGRLGDFFTSVSAGPLFGQLLACQFAWWQEENNTYDTLQLVECGAHDGRLAADILGWLEEWRPALKGRVDYCIVEPSANHRAWQQTTLEPWQDSVKWIDRMEELPPTQAWRVIFCNELLDAMPVHRFSWNAAAQRWEECCVGRQGEKFIWQLAPPTIEISQILPKADSALARVLPNGYILEYSPAAIAWWSQAASQLNAGKLLTLDYGLIADEWLRPERVGGTLRAYSHHRVSADLLDAPGDCDITAHVNFSALAVAGEAAGLITGPLQEQSAFLTAIMARTVADPGSFAEWTPRLLREFKTLAHPEQMGRAFRVMVQTRCKASADRAS